MLGNLKRTVAAGITGFLIGTTITVSAGTWIQAYKNDEIEVMLDGEVQTFRDATTNEIEWPIMYKDRTYLPLRSLATLVGLDVDYDEITDTAILKTKSEEKLSSDYIGEFFDGPVDQLEDGSVFVYGLDKSLYGFENDFWPGCSVWCAVVNFKEEVFASSTLKEQAGISYEASNVKNGERKNAWIEGAQGYGVGEYIELIKMYETSSDYGVDFEKICIVNGYAENAEKWLNNSRVKELKMYFNGEYVANIELEDTMRPQYIDIKELGLKAKSGEEASFKFEIVDVYEGEKYDDTAITGISIEFYTLNH